MAASICCSSTPKPSETGGAAALSRDRLGKAVPAEAPALSAIVSFDEPHPYYAAQSAAPVFAKVNQYALRLLHTGYVRFGRVDHIGEISNDLLQRWVAVDGIFPDLEGVGAQVYFRVRVAIENAGLLREQITHRLIVAVILKKGFICANHLGVFLQPLAHASAQADNTFNTISWQK